MLPTNLFGKHKEGLFLLTKSEDSHSQMSLEGTTLKTNASPSHVSGQPGTDGLFPWLGTNEAVGERGGAREYKTIHL